MGGNPLGYIDSNGLWIVPAIKATLTIASVAATAIGINSAINKIEQIQQDQQNVRDMLKDVGNNANELQDYQKNIARDIVDVQKNLTSIPLSRYPGSNIAGFPDNLQTIKDEITESCKN